MLHLLSACSGRQQANASCLTWHKQSTTKGKRLAQRDACSAGLVKILEIDY